MWAKAFRIAHNAMPAPAAIAGNENPAAFAGAVHELHALIDAGDLAEAGRRIARLAANYSNDPDFQFLLGRLALAKGDTAAAVERIENTVKLRPDFVPAYVELAKLYGLLHEPDRARTNYEAALRLMPDVAELHNNLGLIHLEQERLPEAERCFETALRLRPDFATAKNNLGRVWMERKQYDTAIACLQGAVALDPRDIHARINLGLALIEQGEHEQARVALEACRSESPDRVEVLCGLGTASLALAQSVEAEQYYRQALALDGAYADAHFGLANIAILQGDLAAGWENYEWRMRLPRFARYYKAPGARWKGERLHGKTLLVHDEQGHGDILLFARFLPRLAQSGATVVFRCRRSLARLLQGGSGVDRLVDASDAGEIAADASIPLLSLGRALRIGLSDLPGPIPYLRPPPALVEAWRERLAGEKRFRVGLAWGGNPSRTYQRRRVPQVEDYRALAAVSDVVFYNLQLGAGADAVAQFPVPLIDLTAGIADFADTAAFVEHLDLVISVDTSVAHLCGALGKPTWVLHPNVPDWRWEIAGKESPWYPTARLFRRGGEGWTQTLEAVADALRLHAAGKGSGR